MCLHIYSSAYSRNMEIPTKNFTLRAVLLVLNQKKIILFVPKNVSYCQKPDVWEKGILF